LRKLGKVLHFSNVSKRLIVKSRGPGVSKGYVVDRTGYVIGVVDEVFGPVDQPYYALRPSKRIDPEKYVGEEVFIASNQTRKNTERRKREK